MIKTNKEILKWIYENLGKDIRYLTDDKYKDTPYTESLIAGMICRETGFLILRYYNQGKTFNEICNLMKGDYRNGRYNGYGFVQIDIGSYPKFIKDTPLSDYKAYLEKSILVLEEKRISIERAGFTKDKLGKDLWLKAIVSAYNTGQGNVIKSLKMGKDTDRTTHQGDYAKCVMQFRMIYYDNFIKLNEK